MEILGEHVRDDRAALHVGLDLLHERNDFSERIVDVVRDATGQVRERVLPLDLQHAGLEILEGLRPLERNGRERREALDDGELVIAEGPGRAA